MGYTSSTLEPRKETLGFGTHYVEKAYRVSGASGAGMPARVTARLRMRPIGMDVLKDLVDSGDLDPRVLEQMPTFTLGAQIEWTQADGFMKTIMGAVSMDCSSYRCLLDPGAKGCK
jgi:hypothetical protein